MGNIWLEIKALRAAKHNHTSEIAALKVLVVGDYVKRAELQDIMRDVTREVRTAMGDLKLTVNSGFSEIRTELKSKQDRH